MRAHAVIMIIFVSIVLFCLWGLLASCAPRAARTDFTCITTKDRNDQIVSYCADTATWEDWRAEQRKKKDDARPEM